jgi:hypothetical protein
MLAISRVCAKYEPEIRAIGAPRGSLEREVAIAHKINVMSRLELEAARGVERPARDHKRLEAMFDKWGHALRLADASTRNVTSGHGAANRAALRSAIELIDVNQRLAAYGLTACS